MSHRTALVLSIALTLLLAAGVLAGRDRLFMAEATSGTATDSGPAVSSESVPANAKTTGSDAARIVEIPLPVDAQQADSQPPAAGNESRGRENDDSHSRGSYGEGNEGEDDD